MRYPKDFCRTTSMRHPLRGFHQGISVDPKQMVQALKETRIARWVDSMLLRNLVQTHHEYCPICSCQWPITMVTSHLIYCSIMSNFIHLTAVHLHTSPGIKCTGNSYRGTIPWILASQWCFSVMPSRYWSVWGILDNHKNLPQHHMIIESDTRSRHTAPRSLNSCCKSLPQNTENPTSHVSVCVGPDSRIISHSHS